MSHETTRRGHPGEDRGESKTTRLQKWLKIDPQNRPRVYAQVYEGTELSSLSYWLGIVFSAGIATFGLIQDSPAVIIGAMLISPLMGPIMATGLGLALGDFYLALKAIFNLIASIAVSVALSAGIVWLLPFHSATNEILSRTNPTLLDLGIAIFCGLAGSVGVGRAGGERASGAPGRRYRRGTDAATLQRRLWCGKWPEHTASWVVPDWLFLTNLVAIISSAFAVFLLVGLNASELSEQMKQSREGEFFARRLGNGRVGRRLSHSGNLGWRILIVAVLLGAIAIPLKNAFVQLTEEAAARSAVQQVVKNLLPSGALVSQQVEVGRRHIAVRLFSTQAVPEEKQRQAQQEIQQKSGRPTELSVLSVASQSDLAELAGRLSAASATPLPRVAAKPLSIDDERTELLKRITPVLSAIWPPEAPLTRFDLDLSASAITLDARYQSERDLTPIALGLITKQLQQQLTLPELTLTAHRAAVPPKAKVPRKSARH